MADIIIKYDRIVTVEEHVLQGGLGSYVLEIMADHGILKNVYRMGIDIENGYPDLFGDRDYFDKLFLLDKNGLSASLLSYFSKDL